MKKYFNYDKINNFINENSYLDITAEDIVNKTAYKKIKSDINKIENIEKLYYYNNSMDLIKKFFPNRCEEMSGSELNTVEFKYREDGKIHWSVVQDGNGRTFKLRTDNYLNRTVDERAAYLKYFKKCIDKFYGYWITDDGDITDGNLINGKYKIIR